MTVVASSPAERRRNKIRARILSAAETVFAREGADGLSIRRLAENIDYSPAAIYKYFSSKDELVDELKESFFEIILENVNRIADTSTDFAIRARDCVATYIRVAADKPHHYAAAFTGESASNKPVDDCLGPHVSSGTVPGAVRNASQPTRAGIPAQPNAVGG